MMTGDKPPPRFLTSEQALEYLTEAGAAAPEDLDLAECALALGLCVLPGVSAESYRHHLKKICDQTGHEYQSRIKQEEDSATLRAQILRKIIHEAHGYKGSATSADLLDNANLIRVIDTQKALPIVLGILYLIAGRAQGWEIEGLHFPGHFLVRLDHDSTRLILDPFQKGREMEAADLRELLKSIAGKNAELAHTYYEAADNRDILLRLQNNLKARLIEDEEYAAAIVITDTMTALAPKEYRVLFDQAVLYVKVGQPKRAVGALETYIDKNPNAQEQQYAKLLMDEINNTMMT